MKTWRPSTWGDEISLEYGKALRGYESARGPVRVFGSNGPVGWTDKALATGPGVILGRKGAYRGVQYSKGDFFVIDTAYYVVPKTDLDMRWLYYAIQYHKLGEIDDGSPIPSTTRAAVYMRELDVPPKDVQREMARILESIDNKIDLNRRINQTLEAMAQAIFKSWFVDFDPVKAKIAAKAEGRDPLRAAMSAISGKADAELDTLPPEQYEQLAAIAALFPDEMEESELGEIPKGWLVEPLSKMIQLIGGGTPKRSESGYWGGNVPWYSVKDAPLDGDVWTLDTEEKITNLGLLKSSTKLLPIGTTIISARGTVGKLALVGKEMAMNQSCYGVTGADSIGSYFNYFNLKDAVDVLKRNVHGAVFDTITQATFETVSRIRPLNEQHEAFEQRVRPLLEEIRSRVNQNRILTVLRDTLLPKLLSGELSVEAFTEPAGAA